MPKSFQLMRSRSGAIRPLLLLLFLNLFFTSFSQQGGSYDPETEKRIADVTGNLGVPVRIAGEEPVSLQDQMKKYAVPGVSIAVIRDYKVDWARGFGFADKEAGSAVTVQTLFQAASISKSLNAAGVLKLAQENKVSLDTDINTYLVSWKFPYDTAKGKKPVTLNHLLSHTAGTSVHGFRGYAVTEKVPALIQVLNGEAPANSQPVRPLFEPGTRVQYSGGGTSIAQLLVTDVTGQAYDRYMQQNVLGPLGMDQSFYTIPPPAAKERLLATAYREDGKPVPGRYHLYPEQAAASLWTNPLDLSRFVIEMQQAYKGASGKVLQQPWAARMLTPVQDEAALGVFIKTAGGERYFLHNGGNEGFRCIYLGSLEGGNGVVVMVNSDNGTIINEIVNSVARVYGWKEYYKPVVRTVVPVGAEVLDRYVGAYELGTQNRIVIARNGKALVARATGQPEVELFAEGDNRFFLKVADAQIEFVKDEKGAVTKLVLHQNGRSRDYLRIN